LCKDGSRLVAKEYVEKREKLTRHQRWEQLDEEVAYSGKQLDQMIRRVVGTDATLTNYEAIVNRNFQEWVFRKQAGAAPKFSEEQVEWLRMMKDYIATSFHLEAENLEYEPFGMGGTIRMYDLFGDEMDTIIQELNEALAA
jgi:type I restriction enzyme, R subunit